MSRPSQKSPIIAASDNPKSVVSSSKSNVFLLDLPVLGLVNPAVSGLSDAAQEARLVLGGQCHYQAIIACHPCYAYPMKYTTLHLINGSVLDIQIPYDQWHPFFQGLGKAFAEAAEQAKRQQIVTPADFRGGAM